MSQHTAADCGSVLLREPLMLLTSPRAACRWELSRYEYIATSTIESNTHLILAFSNFIYEPGARADTRKAMSKEMELEPGDFHLAVKRREFTGTPWRWEIWAAGKAKAVAQSELGLGSPADLFGVGCERDGGSEVGKVSSSCLSSFLSRSALRFSVSSRVALVSAIASSF
jgi:hypothetical protein